MEQLFYNGVDITRDISIQRAVHNMFCDGHPDSLELICNDPTGIWSKWNPKVGDRIEFKYNSMTTGGMFVREFAASNGSFSIYAASNPPSFEQTHDRKWENTGLLTIARQIASEHGLSLKTYGVAEASYKEIWQKNQTDLAFLFELATLEGCSMICFDGAIVLAAGTWMDTLDAVMDFEVGEDGKFSYSDSSGSGIGSCTVSRTWYKVIHKPETKGEHAPMGSGAHEHEHDKAIKEKFTGSFKPGDSLGSASFDVDLPVKSNAEAMRFARGLARKKNAFLRKGRFNRSIIPGLAAGSAIELKTDKAGKWNGKQIIYRIRNNYVENISTIYFRSPLKGY